MTDDPEALLLKAAESLAGAESEFVMGRYNNCANRCYYACFQAAVSALRRAGIARRGEEWGHDFVQAQFAGHLVNRRKLYSPVLRDVLPRCFALRQTADYEGQQITETQASRALRRTREFVGSVQGKGANSR
ncbi:MAG: HEPN domain-containing protein [Thermomicrobiales bacterium]